MPRLALSAFAVLVTVAVSAACGGGTPTSPSATTRILTLSGSIAFNGMVVGDIATATLTIGNTGNAPLTVQSITGSGSLPSAASLSWSSGVIPAGTSQAVIVTFRPLVPGTYTGSLIVTGDHTSGTNTHPYSATVLPATPFTGAWSGSYTVTDCQGGGAAQELVCGAPSGNRPGGRFPVGTSLPVTLTLTQQGDEVSGTIALGSVTGDVAGTVDARGLLTLRGTATAGPFTATIVHWSSRVIGNVMDGAVAYAVTIAGTTGVGGMVTSLVVTRQN